MRLSSITEIILIKLHLLLLLHCHTLVLKMSHVDRIITMSIVARAEYAPIGGRLVCLLRLTRILHHAELIVGLRFGIVVAAFILIDCNIGLLIWMDLHYVTELLATPT